MKSRQRNIVAAVVVLSLVTLACALPEIELPSPSRTEPPQTGGDDGPKIITGEVAYTNPFFTAGVAQPVVILEDQGGFVTRDRDFLIPIESQVIGQITSDFYTSPFTYSLALPDQPNGTLHDVDHDGEEETGVMVFAVAYWTNTWGDPFLERRDQGGGGWSGAYASTKVSDDPALYLEVYGGKYLVYALDDRQSFPSDYGDDKKLFTDDDPIMDLPAGWSVIDLDQDPFTIDRSPEPVIDLLEPETAALVDFSDLSYTEAFDKMIEKFKNEYAFTVLKQIDWDAKADEFRPLFEEAEQNQDSHAYVLALQHLIWSIPDAHLAVHGEGAAVLGEDFSTDIAGGLGFAMRETDDGKIVANFILEGGPADAAGMEWGAEILSLDGVPSADVVSASVPWSSPFSTSESERLQQLRYALRFGMDKGQVEVTFRNPGGSEQTAVLDVVGEVESFNFSSFNSGVDPLALPVEFDVLPSGYGYVKISDFLDNEVLTIQVWERALQYFNENQIPGVILDLRNNSGGSGWLADQMAAYFFTEEVVVGNTETYNKNTGEFFLDPDGEGRMIPPREELQYTGPVVVMVGPNCVSACEFFSYNMTVNDRATIVGQYPTRGGGGSVEDFNMPEGITIRISIGRNLDPEGNILIEGTGVVPDVKVPVTVETLQREANGEDVILEAAIRVISEPQGAGVTPAGPPDMASPSDAASAFSSGNNLLEQLAREQYESADYAAPGTLTYTIPLAKSETLIWMYPWCATTTEVLSQNFEHIELKFVLDGEEVALDQFRQDDLENNGMQCRLYYTALSNWQPGEHHLSTTATFTAPINDGTADYEAGDYILNYAVFMKP